MYTPRGFPGGAVVKNPPANAEGTGGRGPIPGWENPLKEEMTTHFSILAWRIPDRGAKWGTVHRVAKSWK